MIYLSHLLVNGRDKNVQRDLRDFYQMHKTLAHAFGNSDEEQQAARVLFRADEMEGKLAVLLQSKIMPDWSTLPKDYCLAIPQVKEINPVLHDGSVWSFRLRANPTKADSSQRVGSRSRGKRIGIYRENERVEWLHRKAEVNGFRILEVRVRDEGRAYPHCRGDGKEYSLKQVQSRLGDRQGSFSAACFDGILQIVDPANSIHALENGIGSAKAFGFGLLSLRQA